jgi:hypothetical protein
MAGSLVREPIAHQSGESTENAARTLARTMGGLFPSANNRQAWARNAGEGYFFLLAAIRDTGFFAYFTAEVPTAARFG